MAKKKTTVTPQLLADVLDLAEKGMSQTGISKTLGISRAQFTRNLRVRDKYQEGENKHRKEVINLWYKDLETNPVNLQKRAQQLHLLSNPLEIEKPKTAKDALSVMGDLIVGYGNGTVSATQLANLTKSLRDFTSIYAEYELEDALEKEISRRG